MSVTSATSASGLPSCGRPRGASASKDLVAADVMVARLVELLRDPTYQPPLLPTVALELLTIARRPDTTVRQIDALLAAEPVLAANLLRVANSPLYSPGGGVRTLRDAIVRLGTRTITAIFFDVWANARLFLAPGYEEPMRQVRRHSTAVAHVARLVSRHTALNDDYAYLCGLLHDIGVALGLLTMADWMPREALPEPQALCGALRDGHAEIGATLCEHWRLPPELVSVVRTHHRIEQDGRVQAGAAIVRIADNVAIRQGFGMPLDHEDTAEERLARDALQLSESDVRGIEDEAKSMLAQLE
jgi:putative nucleotidyltransferase with HDIG domain